MATMAFQGGTEGKGLEFVIAEPANGDAFIVWKLDRLGRSKIHLLLLLDKTEIKSSKIGQGIH